MKPKEYVKKYNLNTQNKFPHDAFIADLTNDFVSNIEYLREVKQLNLTRYQSCVSEVKLKFDGIAAKSLAEKEVWDKLWKYFYATVLIKLKEKLFSKELDEIKQQRENREKWDQFNDFGFFGGFGRLGGLGGFDFFKFARGMLNLNFDQPVPTEEFAELNLDPKTATADDVKNEYRKLAVKYHPDKGGDSKMFRKITEYRNICLSYLEQKVSIVN